MPPSRRSATADDRAARTLESLKAMLDRFAADRASQGKILLTAELQGLHDAIVAQAARQGFVYGESGFVPVTGADSPAPPESSVIDLANRRQRRRHQQH